MKKNKISIKIQRPIREVFRFTIDPKNTPRWIKSIKNEETSEWPIKIGTIYKNKDKSGNVSKYSVVAVDNNRIFELESKDGNYHVQYIYKEISDHNTQLEYQEWVDNGDLNEPFNREILQRMKSVIENS